MQCTLPHSGLSAGVIEYTQPAATTDLPQSATPTGEYARERWVCTLRKFDRVRALLPDGRKVSN